jgi:hypothetical protein
MTKSGKGGLSEDLIKKLITLSPEEIKNLINNKQNTVEPKSEVRINTISFCIKNWIFISSKKKEKRK